MPQVRLFLLALCAIMSTSLMAGCGYHFQQAHNPLVDLGIHRIYVSGFRNKTYRPGIEHYFTTAMVREIGHSKSFDLVNEKQSADAVLTGEVLSTEDAVNATSGIQVPTPNANPRTVNVASEYLATVSCRVELKDRRGRTIFSQTVSDNKAHPGSGALGDQGATAPLNNDSEQRLAVQFLATEMMASVYQRMIDTF